MIRNDLVDLSAFVTVAEERSFTRAAARLGVSQSALSHSMRGLEKRMGVQLLARTTRSVSATAAGTKRCTDLINQLLWLARSDAGNKVELVPTNVVPVVSDVASEAATLAMEKGLTIATELPEAAAYVAIDEASFRRMLLILLDNAVKYTLAGGSISVRVMEGPDNVEIAVQDSGIGIPAEQLPLIFDRFWRADQVRSREAGGTGLGLAIAREIANNHGAELTVESSLGQGSTFIVRLPRSLRQASSVRSSTGQSV